MKIRRLRRCLDRDGTKQRAESNEHPLINHMCLEVNDMDALIAHVRAHDVEISDKKLGGDNTWQAWLTDPSGARIELFAYTDASSQFSGADCIVDW